VKRIEKNWGRVIIHKIIPPFKKQNYTKQYVKRYLLKSIE